MVRAPCCEKMGLKKGPWTPEEDQILINYIQQYGHGNWRALPKQAGLLRCGKSCRLRWTNYLRPDIKRGNFSREEEDTIINLHEMLGNRWSAIAAKLPGRTDNEIKNVWHTHLKKRVSLRKNNNLDVTPKNELENSIDGSKFDQISENDEPKPVNDSSPSSSENNCYVPVSPPQQSVSETSSAMTTSVCSVSANNNTCIFKVDSPENFPEMDENFWSEVLSPAQNYGDFPMFVETDTQFEQAQFSPFMAMEPVHGASLHDGMDFWFDLFTRAGDQSLDLPGL